MEEKKKPPQGKRDQGSGSERDELRIAVVKQRIAQAQRRARKYVKPGGSLVDELFAERRAEASRE